MKEKNLKKKQNNVKITVNSKSIYTNMVLHGACLTKQ